MPFHESKDLNTPPREQRIWRYQDLSRFVSLLEESGLYFSQVGNLGDPFEGSLSKQMLDRLGVSVPRPGQRPTNNFLETIGMARDLVYASCWHANDDESAAMWTQYAKIGQGVAIQSSVGRVIDAVDSALQDVSIGTVTYADYDAEDVPWKSVIRLAHFKRRSFSHEREVRLSVFDPAGKPGQLVEVELTCLIERIVVAPQLPDWVAKLVEKLVARYNLSIPVERSRLEERPIY